jgi:hypothetical protein
MNFLTKRVKQLSRDQELDILIPFPIHKIIIHDVFDVVLFQSRDENGMMHLHLFNTNSLLFSNPLLLSHQHHQYFDGNFEIVSAPLGFLFFYAKQVKLVDAFTLKTKMSYYRPFVNI